MKEIEAHRSRKFGYGKLSLMILEGIEGAHIVEESSVRSHIGKDKLIVRYNSRMLDVPRDVESLWNPPLNVFGGSAKLVASLSTVKKVVIEIVEQVNSSIQW